MHSCFEVVVDGKHYDAVAIVAAHPGRAVLISLMHGDSEVGRVKLVSSLPAAVLEWGHLTEEHFLEAACSQFRERNLAEQALASSGRLLVIELKCATCTPADRKKRGPLS